MANFKVNKQWLKISVECDPQLVGAITDFMVGVMDAGVEVEVEDKLLTRVVNGYLENPGRMHEVNETIEQLSDHLTLLADIFKAGVPTLTTETIEDQDWLSNWKKHFHPFAIVPSLVIAPTWEKYRIKEGEQLIEMDPGMAFGTGHHPTTTLSVRLIWQVMAAENGITVLDVGTGTGILAMAAALFGAEKVLGIDNDPEAVTVAEKNVRANGLDTKIQIAISALSDLDQPFFLVVANIIHDVLFEMADDLSRLTTDSGHLILSGILHGEQSRSMIDCFEKRGFVLIRSEELEEWSGLLFSKFPI